MNCDVIVSYVPPLMTTSMYDIDHCSGASIQ